MQSINFAFQKLMQVVYGYTEKTLKILYVNIEVMISYCYNIVWPCVCTGACRKEGGSHRSFNKSSYEEVFGTCKVGVSTAAIFLFPFEIKTSTVI